MSTKRHIKIMATFGKRLKLARERAGDPSAEQFAGALGVHPHTYRHYERGQSEPNLETLTRMCELLRITTDELLPIRHPSTEDAQDHAIAS